MNDIVGTILLVLLVAVIATTSITADTNSVKSATNNMVIEATETIESITD